MAKSKNTISFEVKATATGFDIVRKKQKGLADSIDNTEKKTKNLDKTQQKNYGRQKQGLIQTANGTKNFSKLSQTIGGGSSGLVGAYATLAANVFAASAAFNALARASKFQQLQEGLELLGNQSGRTLSILATNIRDITGSAISMEQAFSGAALGISGGFGATELTGLAKIAKGAANALGRDLGDAFDRLTRGAIKLEPEILDELGIMVRLDDAVDTYATSLGKSAGALSQVERRQAFMNAILVQGEAKFGDIADSVDNSVYDELGASFSDLTKEIFTFVNESLGLEHVMRLLADNSLILGGSLLLFGSTIAGQMIPALGNAGAAAQSMAAKTRDIADAAEETTNVTAGALKSQISSYKSGGDGIKQFRLAVDAGSDSVRDAQTGLKSVNASMVTLQGNATRSGVAMSAANQKLMIEYQAQAGMLTELIALETGRAAANIAAANAGAAARAASATSDAISAFGGGAATFGATMSAITVASKAYGDELTEIAVNALPDGTKKLGIFQTAQIKGTVRSQKFGAQIRLLGASFLGLLAPLAAVLITLGLLFFAYNKIFNTPKTKEFKKNQEELSKILETQTEKREEFEKAGASNMSQSAIQIRQFEIISNSIGEANEKIKEQIRLRILANKEREGTGAGDISLGKTKEDADKRAQQTTIALVENPAASSSGGGGEDPFIQVAADIEQQFKNFQGITADNFIDLESFKEMKQDDRLKLTSSIFQAEDTGAQQSFLKMIGEDIPLRTEILKKQLNMTAIIGANAEAVEKEFARAIDEADKVTQHLATSMKSVTENLKTAEKNAGAFIRALTPKSSADAISLSFQAIVTESNYAFEQAEKAGAGAAESIGKAFTDTGPNIARLMGTDFQNDLKAVKDKEQEIIDLRASGAGEDALKAQAVLLKKLTETLGGHKETYEETFKRIMDIQTAEITRKNIMEKQKKILGFIKKIQIEGVSMVKLDLAMQKQNFALQTKQRKAKQDTVKGQFSNLKMVDENNKLTETAISLEDFKAQSLEDQRRITIANGIEITNLNGLRNIGHENAVAAFEEQVALAGEEHQAIIGTNQALLKVEETRKRIVALQTEGALQEATINNFARTGQTELGTNDAAQLEMDVALERSKNLEKEKTARQAIIDAEFALNNVKTSIMEQQVINLNKEIDLENSKQARLLAEGKITELTFTKKIDFDRKPFDDAAIAQQSSATTALNQEFTNIENGIKLTVMKGIKAGMDSAADGSLQGAETVGKGVTSEAGVGGTAVTSGEFFALAQTQVNSFKEGLLELGPEGAAIGAVSQGAVTVASALATIGDANASAGKKMDAAKAVFSAIGSVMATQAKAQEAAVDTQINAEKKRDGKSKESLAKIKAMEAKKVAIQRKAFEQNKKVQLANAIITGFSAIQSGFATPPFFPVGLAMGAFAIAQTAMQIQGIRKQTFQGGGGDSASASAAPSTIAVGGKRSNKVDVSKSAGSSEMDYLRGGKGIGSNANNFRGAAMGLKGYAAGGVVVGERGPEVYDPTNQEIIPNYDLGGGKNMNVTFNVNAVDAQSVEALLNNNQGAVVGAIRNAANSYGQDFLPDVNVGYEMTEK